MDHVFSFIYFSNFFVASFGYFYGAEYGQKQTKTGKRKTRGFMQEKIEFEIRDPICVG